MEFLSINGVAFLQNLIHTSSIITRMHLPYQPKNIAEGNHHNINILIAKYEFNKDVDIPSDKEEETIHKL